MLLCDRRYWQNDFRSVLNISDWDYRQTNIKFDRSRLLHYFTCFFVFLLSMERIEKRISFNMFNLNWNNCLCLPLQRRTIGVQWYFRFFACAVATLCCISKSITYLSNHMFLNFLCSIQFHIPVSFSLSCLLKTCAALLDKIHNFVRFCTTRCIHYTRLLAFFC